MLTVLFAISAFASVGRYLQPRTSETIQRSMSLPVGLSTHSDIPDCDVHTTGPCHEGLVPTLSSVCNSLTTPNVRDAIRKRRHDGAEISLAVSSSSASDGCKADGWCAFCPLPPLTRPLAQGIVFKSDVGSCKYIAVTIKTHDGNGSKSLVSPSFDERDIGGKSCYERHSERIKILPRVRGLRPEDQPLHFPSLVLQVVPGFLRRLCCTVDMLPRFPRFLYLSAGAVRYRSSPIYASIARLPLEVLTFHVVIYASPVKRGQAFSSLKRI